MSEVTPAESSVETPAVEVEGGKPEFTPPATQADLDRIIESRLARERDKFKDYDDLVAQREEFESFKESQKSERDRELDEIKSSTTSEVTQRFLGKLVSTEVQSIAATLGFNDPADALAVIGDKLPVDGEEVDSDEIRKRVEKLAEDKPYLVKVASAPTPKQRPRIPRGEKQDDGVKKSSAAAALRQLGASRRSS